jgi:hypothetical protein
MRNINQNVNSHALMAASALNRTSGLCACVLLAIPAAVARVRVPGFFILDGHAAAARVLLRCTWHIAQYVPKICRGCVLLRDYKTAVPMATHRLMAEGRWHRRLVLGTWCWTCWSTRCV